MLRTTTLSSARFVSTSCPRGKDGLILPHGGKLTPTLISDPRLLKEEQQRAAGLQQIDISSRENGDLIMMGIGGFSPLTGFMVKKDWHGVCKNYLLSDGTFWPIPITLSVDGEVAKKLRRGQELALRFGPQKEIVGTLKADDLWEMRKEERDFESNNVFKTTDIAHPGVKMVTEQKAFNIGGRVKTFSEGEFPKKYAGIYMRPSESRAIFAQKGWKNIAALQLRNPMHRSHEYLAKIAAEICDGVFIHSLVGNLKPGDIPAEVRVKCIDALVKHYFVGKNIQQGGYPLDMRYGGPREALLHALFRQNYGCTHMIIGRDHAGVGDYYGPFDAHKIFNTIPVPSDPTKALQCQPMRIDWTFYCRKCDGMASLRTCPHEKKDRVIVSGTMVRKMLSEGSDLPDHFSRPEIVEILKKYYMGLDDSKKVKITLQKFATGAAM